MNEIILTPWEFAMLAGALILPFFAMSFVCAVLFRKLLLAETMIGRLAKERNGSGAV